MGPHSKFGLGVIYIAREYERFLNLRHEVLESIGQAFQVGLKMAWAGRERRPA